MGWCKFCVKNVHTERGHDGITCCTTCGKVLDADVFSDEPTFFKGAGGKSQLSGSFVRSVEGAFLDTQAMKRGRDEIDYLATNLNISGGDSTVGQAARFYKMAVERNFTRGRPTSLVAAACLYIVCRTSEPPKPFLLIDFSEELRVNVYVVGAVFLQLSQLLRLGDMVLVDPTLFIHRFTECLLKDKNIEDERAAREIKRNTRDILASMKRDWMQTGRKPSGLCGAALYISANSFGIKCSKSDIENIVHVCEATLTKRLVEFENTDSGSLTIEELNLKENELQKESRLRSVPNLGSDLSEDVEPLCKHEGPRRPVFAGRLCRSCCEFVELSGGLQGGADPPAFQRAKKEKADKVTVNDKDSESILCEEEPDPFSQTNLDVNSNEKLDPCLSEGVANACHGNEDNAGFLPCDESETLSDIDDTEVNGYLHNEDEKRMKTIIWETMNKEYLEEQAAKEKELGANSAKPKKERKRRKPALGKDAPPVEVIHEKLTKKIKSSKINYDVLAKLLDDEPTSPRNTNPYDHTKDELNVKSDWNEDGKGDFVDNEGDIEQEDEFGFPDNATGMYGEDTYPGIEEEYYGYDEDY
ncbi:hypothetical protein ACHQM5_019436 [Ranunculus cassubicifolius]